jgi:chorismate mutase
MAKTCVKPWFRMSPHSLFRLAGPGAFAYECKRTEPEDAVSDPELLRLRNSIDNLDAALIHLLAERFKCTQAVGVHKATHNLPPADPAREAAQIARLRRLAQEAKLDPDFAEKFFNFVVTEVIRHHEALRTKG